MKILDLINVTVVAETATGSLLLRGWRDRSIENPDKVTARRAVY